MLTPEEIASSEEITGLSLSSDASLVVYSVGSRSRTGDHATSALWLAETDIRGSARQFTSGEFHDRSPAFHPDGSDIYFLSDRHGSGGPAQIYRVRVSSPVELVLVTSPITAAGISSFSISPNGRYIAFISPDKFLDGMKDATADPEIWGDKRDLGRLRLLDLADASKRVRTMVSVDAHVDSFSWSPNSSQIVYRLATSSDRESSYLCMVDEIFSIDTAKTTHMSVRPRMSGSRLAWTSEGHLFFQAANPGCPPLFGALWMCNASENPASTRVAYGEIDDLNHIAPLAGSKVAAEIAFGLGTRIDVVNSIGVRFTAFETTDDAITPMQWDIKFRDDGSYVLVALRSSGVTGEPENIWSGTTTDGEKGLLSKKLSSHHGWFTGKKSPICKPFYWKGYDGQPLRGIISYPADKTLLNLPTVVIPHCGPHRREVLDLCFSYDRWRPFLASQGYLVLCPNYRGDNGETKTSVGRMDWADIESMIDKAVAQKFADPGRLGIAGHNQCAFLAAWGCTRPNSRFKAGVICGGVSDWGALYLTSDIPDLEACLGGSCPWVDVEPPHLKDNPVKDVKKVRIPLLILHGKENQRVPVSQATGFMRALVRAGNIGAKSQLVIYPREGSKFEERAHAVDVCRRLLEYLNARLK